MRSNIFSQDIVVMSSIDSIGLHLGSAHLRKLGNGHNIQLSHDQLKTAINGEPTADFEMAKKHITELLRAHRQGKGYRIMHKKIHGGKITLKSIGRKISHAAKAVMHNSTVKKVAKELGHLPVGVANNYAMQNGVDTTPYAHIANRAIESKNIKKELEDQMGHDIMSYANEKAAQHYAGGKIKMPKIPKGLKDFGHGFVKGLKTVANNPIAQGVATNLITGALMGAGPRRRAPAKRGAGAKKFVKGSAEAKAHMARIRAHKSGGALMPAGAGVKKRPLKFN
jgi:hypothetical protein